MVLHRYVRYSYVLVSLLVVSSTCRAKNNDAEWFGSDDGVSEPSTRRTTSPAWEFVPRTRTSTPPPPVVTDVNAADEDDASPTLPSTTTIYGSRRSTTTTTTSRKWEFIPRRTRPPVADVSTGVGTVTPPSSPNIVDTMTTLLTDFSKFANPTSVADEHGVNVFASVLRLEVFTIAAAAPGHHFVLVPGADDEKVERTRRKRASGVTALWLDLFCAEDVDAILNNVTRETATQYGDRGSAAAASSSSKWLANEADEILRTLFNKLNDAMEEDSFLATMYTAEQIRHTVRQFDATPAAKKAYVSLDDLALGRVDENGLAAWLNDVQIRKLLIHGQVLRMRRESAGGIVENDVDENDVWVRTVLKVGRERCCMDRMQKIYTSTLNETANNLVVGEFPQKTVRTFVDKVTRAIEADDGLQTEWVKQKKAVREKLTRTSKSVNHHRRVEIGGVSPA